MNEKVYVVYKVINIINNKFYIGVHRTDNLNNNYLGSGKRIVLAVAKEGRQKFKKEVLLISSHAKEAFDKEREILALYLNSPLCYNLAEGGIGGWGNYPAWNKGIPCTEERKKHLSEMYRGEKHPQFGKKQ